MCPAGRANDPDSALTSVDLPAPFGPMRATISHAFNGERHAIECRRRSVPDDKILYLDHRIDQDAAFPR